MAEDNTATSTGVGYGTIPADGYTQQRRPGRPARPPMVIIRTGSYGYGSFSRMPSSGAALRQKSRRALSHMKEAEPLLEDQDNNEEEEASTQQAERAIEGSNAAGKTLKKDEEDDDSDDDEEEETKSVWYLILLTLGIGGYVLPIRRQTNVIR